jgi:hypothetical protein
MTLIDQFNAFCRASKGKLTLAERGLYMTLLDIWNRVPGRRPEWFDVSIPQIMHEAKIGSNNTVIKTRESLEKKGFIETRSQGRGKAIRVKLVRFQTSAENELLPVQKMHYHQCNNCTTTSAENELLPVQKMHTSQSRENYTEIYTEGGERQQPISTPENIPPTVPDEILNSFQNKLRPLRGDELGDLAVLTEEYGTRKMMGAIDKAEARGKRDLNYVRGILRNWRDGEDDNHDNMGGNTSQGESADEWADRLAAEYHL